MKNYTLGSVVRSGVWGILIGGATGFALGVLLAPEEGRRVRRRAAYQLERLAEEVGRVVDHFTRPESTSEARRTGDALVADAKAEAERIREEIDALLGEFRQQGSARSSSSSAE